MSLSREQRKFILENINFNPATISRKLKKRNHNVSVGNVRKFIKTMNLDKLQSFSRQRFNKKIVFPYIGGWFFDIGFNASKGKENGEQGDKQWALFCHGNSGYIIPYVINSKSTESLQRVIEQFVSDCRHLRVLVARGNHLGITKVNYPVKTIIADLERGLLNVHVPGVKIKQFNASESHRTLSRINIFMKNVKQWAERVKNFSYSRHLFINREEMNELCAEWNSQPVAGMKCSRGDILSDESLEKAYICRCLYINEGKDADIADTIHPGMTVEARVDKKEAFGPSEGRLRQGKYKIENVLEGNRVELSNIFNPGEHFTTNLNYITAGGDTKLSEAYEDVKDVEAPRISQEFIREIPKVNITKKEEKKDPIQTRLKEKSAKLQFNLFKKLAHDNPVEPIKEEIKTFNDLEPKKQQDLAEAIDKILQEEEFNRGLFIDFNPEHAYNRLQTITKNLSPDQINYFYGNRVVKKRTSPKTIAKILKAIKDFYELPEERKQDVANSNHFSLSPYLLKTRKPIH